jgi:hypothetical protein
LSVGPQSLLSRAPPRSNAGITATAFASQDVSVSIFVFKPWHETVLNGSQGVIRSSRAWEGRNSRRIALREDIKFDETGSEISLDVTVVYTLSGKASGRGAQNVLIRMYPGFFHITSFKERPSLQFSPHHNPRTIPLLISNLFMRKGSLRLSIRYIICPRARIPPRTEELHVLKIAIVQR